MKSFPLFVDMVGQTVVICGGGEEAARKTRLIAKSEAKIVLMAPELCPELAKRVKSGARHVAATVTPEAFRGARLVITATGCAAADAAIADLARAAGALVNAVDRPELCDVTMPAIVDRDPVVVAIGTEGTAPVLARQVKSRIEELLEPSLGAFARLAGDLRHRVAHRIAPTHRRRFWEWLFDAPRQAFALGERNRARANISAALEAGTAPARRGGQLTIVGAASADMIALRGVARLQAADLVIHDPDLDPTLLELPRRDADREALTASWPTEVRERL
ncbi:MAG: NAD(P)-dependent oxidoreductase, partial [Pseudomonadota bacterium]